MGTATRHQEGILFVPSQSSSSYLIKKFPFFLREREREREREKIIETIKRPGRHKLLNLANIQVPIRGCGLEEIHRFQIFFATRATALVVYSFRNFARDYPPLYDGTRFVMDTHSCVTKLYELCTTKILITINLF